MSSINWVIGSQGKIWEKVRRLGRVGWIWGSKSHGILMSSEDDMRLFGETEALSDVI